MSQKQSKAKAKKEQPWNSFAYLGDLAKRKERTILHLSTNTVEDESQLEGIIIGADNYTLAFLANNGRELLVFKHAIRFIERVRESKKEGYQG